MVQQSLFAELSPVVKDEAKPALDWCCSKCFAETPHLFKGIRYCADHHPDPGPHIRLPKALAA